MHNWENLQNWLNESNALEIAYKNGDLHTYLPEVYALFGIPQPEEHHPEIDSGLHTILVLEKAKQLSSNPIVWFAALTHDLGKALTPINNWPQHINHEELGLKPLNDIINRFELPDEVSQLARISCREHLKAHKAFELRPGNIIQWFEKLEFYENNQLLNNFLIVCEADALGRLGLDKNIYLQKYLLQEIYDITKNSMKLPMLETREITLGLAVSTVKTAIHSFHDKRSKQDYIMNKYNITLPNNDIDINIM